MTPQEFITKWKRAELWERSAAEQHIRNKGDEGMAEMGGWEGAWFRREGGEGASLRFV